MPWLEAIFEVAENAAEPLAEQLSACGAVSVTLQDAGDQPVYEPALNTVPLWRQTRVTGLFEQDDAEALRQQLAALPPPLAIQPLQERDWVRSSLADLQPMQFGRRLWVCPSWQAPPQADAVNLMLDPGLAFGTGTHPTTALCLEWLDAQPDLAGLQVIDYGCGSGILAIAAALLGAANVDAVDNDPQALQATAENALKNQVEERIHGYLPQCFAAAPADILLANILANPLCQLAPRLAALVKPGGWLVLSGILAEQADQVLAAYQAYIGAAQRVERDGWIRLALRRKEV
jgi:ribosomal protein L11 methyltransferase